jgi:hypothetical protein
VIATAWFGAWAVLLNPASPRAPRAAPPVPRVVYLPAESETLTPTGATAEARMLWSPVLFSLPTSLGFSRDALTNEVRMRPPLGQYGGFTNFLERTTHDAPVLEPLPSADLRQAAAGTPEVVAMPDSESPAFDLVSASTSALFQVMLLDGLAGRRFAEARLPVHPWVNGAKPWEAVAYLELDGGGRVVHAFIENPSPSETLNARLAQVLRGWRLAEPGSADSGRVVFRNKGRTPESAGPAGEGAP